MKNSIHLFRKINKLLYSLRMKLRVHPHLLMLRFVQMSKRLKIYTRTGDKGTSSLYTGERRSKDDLIFHVLGNTDELSSCLGLAREYCQESKNGIEQQLVKIQSTLLDLGSHVATPRNSISEFKLSRTEFDNKGDLARELEEWIDIMDVELPPLKNFILPSGGKAASALHISRSVCRRAERSIVPLVIEKIAQETAQRYLNRLSDYLFTAARFASVKEGKAETIYQKS
jgi:cob(I)alamin adenosyltransferase